MALISGYVVLPVDSYAAWKAAVNGNGYDADGYYGYQCWDLVAEFWYNVGFPQAYPQTGPNQYASECWNVSREQNASYNGTTYFDLITNFADIKQGDVIVWNGTSSFPTGHIGFADEDYNPESLRMINVLGQNQGSGGTPPPVFPAAGGSTTNVNRLSLVDFAGAFRYKAWHSPTPPTPSFRENHYPWVLYARKLRQTRQGL